MSARAEGPTRPAGPAGACVRPAEAWPGPFARGLRARGLGGFGGVPRALVAEDDAVCRAMAVACLARLGFAPLGVGDGSAAWALLGGEARFAVLVANWLLPGMDGHAICRRLRTPAGRPGAPQLVILTGGPALDGSDDHPLVADADARLIKPYGPEGLRAALERGLAAVLEAAIRGN